MSAVVEAGNSLQVHYTGTLEDGSIFDSSEGRDPLEFTLGKGMLIPGFESAVMGLKEGETNTVTLPPAEAYGEAHEENIFEVSRSQFPEGVEPEVGMMMQVGTPNGPMPVKIAKFDDENVSLDANHELAGKTLTFKITVVKIMD